MGNKKLNLTFGAEIKELVVKFQRNEFKSLDGINYSFEKFTTNPGITKLLTQSFRDIQSVNSSDRSKQKTNGSIRFGIRKFLKWIESKNYQGDFSYQLLLEYKKSLEKENSWTAYSSYAVVIRLVLNLINKGLIGKFIVPKNIPLQQAKNSAKTGITIASILDTNSENISNDDINEKVLSLIIDTLWEETFKLFDYLELGEKWCSEISNKEYIPYKSGMKRDEALQNIIKNCYIEFKGLPIEYSFYNRFKGHTNINFIKVMNRYINANQYYKWKLGPEEINKYFYPTKKLASNIIVLLVASQINPESAIYLDKNCLHSDIDENITRISWVKNRAGGEQTNMPFPTGKHKQAKTIPNVIERYLNYSSNMHSFVSEKNQNLLFVFRSNTTGKMASFQIFNSGPQIMSESINLIKENLLKKESSIIVDLALQSLDKLTLNLIRTTALNIAGKRLNRDISALASMDGRKTEKVLVEHYLNNSETKQNFDNDIRQSQKLMENWVYEKPIVIKEDKEKIAKSLSIDSELAKKILNDEFNNGYGASFINNYVIIIDSPLNALRIIQWLHKINQDKNLIKLNNPERWSNIYAPQISLFNEALNLMSKKSKQEAKKLNNEIQLPFPEVL